MRCFFLVAAAVLLPATGASAACVPGLSVGASAVNFGTYDPAATPASTSTGTITVQCAIGLLPSFSVALSTGSSGSFATRQMTLGTNRLSYNLYANAGRTMVWGDGTGGTSVQTFNALLSLGSTAFTVYGSAPARQYPEPGLYNDTITVTVTF